MSKQKAHIRYKTKDGKRVPGVTTILGLLNKPALVPWANKLGLEGIDVRKYVDDKADIGTLAHLMIMSDLTNSPYEVSEYSKKQIDQAENAVLSYFEWKKSKKVLPILVEEPLVSEVYGYGGTVDLLAEVDGVPTLIDFKTGKAIYPEMMYQVAAYDRLMVAQVDNEDYASIPVPEQWRIIRVGRDEDEGFEDKPLPNIGLEWEIFKNLLNIYKLQKEIKNR